MWARDFTLEVGSRSNTASKNKSIVRGLAYHRKIYKLLAQWQRISAPEQTIHIEPWLRNLKTRKCCQPDFVLEDKTTQTAIVGEVKLNWKDGRDEKLINLYLDAARVAFGLIGVWPVLITSNIRGLHYSPRLGLGSMLNCDDWEPGAPTPIILVP